MLSSLLAAAALVGPSHFCADPAAVHAVVAGKHRCGEAVWRALRRPLRLPVVEPDQPCPRSSLRRVDENHGPGAGPGPVYPLLYNRVGNDALLVSGPLVAGWHFIKTIWIAPPERAGPVLVRGARLDGTDPVRFSAARTAPRLSELRLVFRRDPNRGWTEGRGPRYTLVRAAGCYVFQVDGLRFSRLVVFEVRTS